MYIHASLSVTICSATCFCTLIVWIAGNFFLNEPHDKVMPKLRHPQPTVAALLLSGLVARPYLEFFCRRGVEWLLVGVLPLPSCHC